MLIRALHVKPMQHPQVVKIDKDKGAESIIGSDIEYTLSVDDDAGLYMQVTSLMSTKESCRAMLL